ncbi:hypothetical protein FNV43_RR08162 [Rhamnella rubrinervis]|uniref:Uncharacterized protein n=1 Tax=Rhamnella rubrinervis TaxID=2594499 RepID=A0A8K0HGL4_9ROSA|nr:hypothetical protein FNV43_RR08162 [Rhamnella rubrinervis]
MHISPLFIEIKALQETLAVGKRDFNHAIPFTTQNGSNRLSSSRPIVDINGSGIRNKENPISFNEIKENIALNLNNENDITMADHVLPIIDEYDRLYNLYNYDVDYDNNTNVGMQEDDIALDDDIELNHDRMRGDDEVNDTIKVQSEQTVMLILFQWSIG